MPLQELARCPDFPCRDTRRAGYRSPAFNGDPAAISILLISEAAPASPTDGYGAGAEALFARTTLLAFQEAGAPVRSIEELQALGVYLTTAVKCSKTGTSLTADTIERCSRLLEREIAHFPSVRVFLLMGDVAIQALNRIARRNGEPRVIPAGSTYKIRTGEYQFRGARALPSYVQAGPAFFVEKSKRRMIAEDLRLALRLAGRDDGTAGSLAANRSGTGV